VRGSLLKPVANGFLRFGNGVLQLADQTVRDLDAVVLFDFSSLELQALTARVGKTGELSGSGDLNLFSPTDGPQPRQLSLTFKQVPFKLARMAAVADGTVEIGGSLLRPVLGGELALSHGALNVQPGHIGVTARCAEIALHVDQQQGATVGSQSRQHGQAPSPNSWRTAAAMPPTISPAMRSPFSAVEPLADESTPEGGTHSVRVGYMS